jgi:hypothetical protein
MSLVNHTLLDPTKYSIYVDGYSTTSGLTLQPSSTSGVLGFAAQTGTVSSFQLGKSTGEYNEIQFSSSQTIVSARIYLFVVPGGQPAPSYAFGSQPANPPSYPYLYEYVELTQPATGGRPTVDISTVDGFTFPVTLTLNDNLGQVGQSLRGLRANRPVIIEKYGIFMSTPGRNMYKPLILPGTPRAAGESGGLLNPYAYLVETSGINPLPKNVSSPLNTVFDAALNTLFSQSGWSLMGTDSNVYTATAGNYQYASQVNPATSQPVVLPGLQFTGGGNTFNIFNPTAGSTLVGTNGQEILATTYADELNQIILANAPAAQTLKPGMYVVGTFFNQNNGQATNYITKVTIQAGKTILTLANALPFGVTNDQVGFSPLPYLSVLETTSGGMVFGGDGFFADAVQQGWSGNPETTLANLENQIDEALNRGVAAVPSTKITPGPLTPPSTGYATRYWGTQTNWYPAGQPQNLFSLFMHTATIGGHPIFVRPSNPSVNSRGELMGSAYGFSFDENPGPVPPAPAGQPEVPSKFDPVPAGTTTITITLDHWFSIA